VTRSLLALYVVTDCVNVLSEDFILVKKLIHRSRGYEFLKPKVSLNIWGDEKMTYRKCLGRYSKFRRTNWRMATKTPQKWKVRFVMSLGRSKLVAGKWYKLAGPAVKRVVMMGSHVLGQTTDYQHRVFVVLFSHPLNAGTIPWNRLRPLPHIV
jgi:hypothetical protein